MPAVSNDFEIALETLLSISTSALIDIEAAGQVAADAVISHEARGDLAQDLVLALESLVSISRDAVIPLASEREAAASFILPLESLADRSRDFQIYYEPRQGGTDSGILPAAPGDVLPEIGSAIYTFWSARRILHRLVHRAWDGHETAALLEDATRHAWSLKMEVSAAKADEIWDFILDHKGAAAPFYFYDLQHNGFVYDEDGVITTGRYVVRFDDTSFPRVYRRGERFVLEFSIIEVE